MQRRSRSSHEPENLSQTQGLGRVYFLKIVSLALQRYTRCDPKLNICGGCTFQKRGFWPSGIHENYPLFQKIRIVCSVPLTPIGRKFRLRRTTRDTTYNEFSAEQMFHSFHLNQEHRDFVWVLRFQDNDPKKEIIPYQITVHPFGNGPSLAVATFGLRKAADVGEEEYGSAAKEFVRCEFYVNDRLASRAFAGELIQLVKNTQSMLATANLRLHKVVSNSVAVMEALPVGDRTRDMRDLNVRHDVLPTMRSLGVCWAPERDSFTFEVSVPQKPFRRRGVLSIVSFVYDALRLVAPVLLEGILLLRELE